MHVTAGKQVKDISLITINHSISNLIKAELNRNYNDYLTDGAWSTCRSGAPGIEEFLSNLQLHQADAQRQNLSSHILRMAPMALIESNYKTFLRLPS